MVALEDIAAALATCGAPVAVTIDPALRAGRRGPVPVVAARRDLGWETLVDHWEGGRRMVVAARG